MRERSSKNWRHSRRRGGFTIIEVLVAIAITVIVSGIAYAFFENAIAAAEDSERAVAKVNRVEAVWQTLATDIHHLIDRELPATDGGLGSSGTTPTFMGGDPNLPDAHFLLGGFTLRFARDGWANPLGQTRSDMQRVGYLWREGELWRAYWAERNQPYDSEPTGQRLLAEGVETLRIRFLPSTAESLERGPWLETWPPGRTAQDLGDVGNLPAAIEITLTLEDEGDVQRLFTLPGL